MTRVFRLVRRPYAATPLDGEGAFRFGGRWSSAGTRVAYTSEHLSLAMVEYFVHLDSGWQPQDLVSVAVDVPEGVSRAKLGLQRLPSERRGYPAPAGLARFGDAFVQQAKTAILIVPSALVPGEFNWLINPAHPDSRLIRVQAPVPLHYDPRFF